MTQDPRIWAQGGLPQDQAPQQGPPPPPVGSQGGGYPQGAGYPPGGGHPQPGYPPQGYPQPGYPPHGYPQPGAYPQQPGNPPQGGYAPGGYGSQGPGAGFGNHGPQRKSPLVLVLIVVAAVVLVAVLGGVIMAFSRNGGSQPATSITPGQPTAPPDDPDSTPEPSSRPSSTSSPRPSSTSSDNPSTPPSGGSAVGVGNGIAVTPVSGWSVKKKTASAAQLSDGRSLFLGQSAKVSSGTNPGQLCTAWHKQVAEDTTGGKYQDPKSVDLGTSKLKGSTCLAQVTVSTGQGSGNVYLFSLVSVRASDGVTVLGTTYFAKSVDSEQLNKDFTAMVNSMLKTQARS